ncbi:MAG: DUF1320 domain-containing protein [Cyanobacteria bacterium P01_H01_bin.121]
MVYATELDFTNSYGLSELVMLTNPDDSAAQTVNSDAFDNAEVLMSARIDGYLRAGGYALPLAEVPATLTQLAVDMIRYHLNARNPSEDARDRYRDAIRYLEQLSKGQVDVGLSSTGAAIAQPSAVGYVKRTPIFSDQALEGF